MDLVTEIKEDLVRRLRKDGFANVSDAVGAAFPEISGKGIPVDEALAAKEAHAAKKVQAETASKPAEASKPAQTASETKPKQAPKTRKPAQAAKPRKPAASKTDTAKE